jgi:D-glycero-alpha-D-manno-heptose-7-phosphate kinase
MIISRTPLRVSFCGGGTDLPAFYESCGGGAVVATAINKYIYINVNRKFDNHVRASYSITEIVEKGADLKHELIREALDLVGIHGGIEITSIADIPSQGTGLGSSSCFTVGLLNALYAFTHRRAGPDRIARQACEIEIERLGKPIGKQDQYAAAFGGLQYIQFNSDGGVFVEPIICRPDTKNKLQERLMMFYTGVVRSADNILSEQSKNSATDVDKQLVLKRMKGQADQLRDALTDNDLDSFGELLNDGWNLKRTLASGISSANIDRWYETARNHGAIGGKLLGAGGGGFLLFYAYPEHHELIKASLHELKHTPFRLESQGTKIVYVEENENL